MRKLQVFLDWGGGGENISYPVTGVLVRNAGSVFVIVHSAFVLRWSARIGQ